MSSAVDHFSDTVVSVLGLGYVGLPVAVAMAEKFPTIGFDINERRIQELRKFHDSTREISAEELRASNLVLTSDLNELKKANFHIVAVPTPVDEVNQPDMAILLKASETLGNVLKKGDVVVYESTVFPGATEDDCLPVLERVSGLKSGVDFKVGYSPERINPGDKEHVFKKITKVVSGQDRESLDKISFVYRSVVDAGVHEAESIKVAEAAKVIENIQRDINIALMNELSVIFEKMNIDTLSVLKASGTKWNFLPFRPGLVGGHCIGVDPYYLTYKAEKMGYTPEVILAGRRLNDSMGDRIVQRLIKAMIRRDQLVSRARVTILGLTFKENCPDLRNTKVIDIVNGLKEYGVEVQICDPEAHPEEALSEYDLRLTALNELKPASAVIVAVAHGKFKELGMKGLEVLLEPNGILFDVKGLYPLEDLNKTSWEILRL